MKNAYQILNVSEKATDEEIRRAYQIFSADKSDVARSNPNADVVVYNPNINLEDLTWAFTTLLNPIERKKHDEDLEKDRLIENKYIYLVDFIYPIGSEINKDEREKWILRLKQVSSYDEKEKLFKILEKVTYRGNYMNFIMYLYPNIDINECMDIFNNSNPEDRKKLYTDIYGKYIDEIRKRENSKREK